MKSTSQVRYTNVFIANKNFTLRMSTNVTTHWKYSFFVSPTKFFQSMLIWLQLSRYGFNLTNICSPWLCFQISSCNQLKAFVVVNFTYACLRKYSIAPWQTIYLYPSISFPYFHYPTLCKGNSTNSKCDHMNMKGLKKHTANKFHFGYLYSLKFVFMTCVCVCAPQFIYKMYPRHGFSACCFLFSFLFTPPIQNQHQFGSITHQMYSEYAQNHLVIES